jgi:hypothetical protein
VKGFHLLGQDLVASLLAEEHEQFADGAVDQLPFTDLLLTEGNEGNEEGGGPACLFAVGIAAAGHASVTDLPLTEGNERGNRPTSG